MTRTADRGESSHRAVQSDVGRDGVAEPSAGGGARADAPRELTPTPFAAAGVGDQ